MMEERAMEGFPSAFVRPTSCSNFQQSHVAVKTFFPVLSKTNQGSWIWAKIIIVLKIMLEGTSFMTFS